MSKLCSVLPSSILILEGNAYIVIKAKYYPRVELTKVIIVGNLYFQNQ